MNNARENNKDISIKIHKQSKLYNLGLLSQAKHCESNWSQVPGKMKILITILLIASNDVNEDVIGEPQADVVCDICFTPQSPW